MTREQLKERVRKLPMQPGVYMHKDKTGKVIYVGKAKLLKNRVSNYFQPPERLNAKTRQLVSHIDDFDIIVTDSEFEALVLENSMIKKYKPKYNILLKDDKGYPYVRLDTTLPYPDFKIVSKPAHDGARYFGPYMGRGLLVFIEHRLNALYRFRLRGRTNELDRTAVQVFRGLSAAARQMRAHEYLINSVAHMGECKTRHAGDRSVIQHRVQMIGHYLSSAACFAASALALAAAACLACISLNLAFSSSVGTGSMQPFGHALVHILQFLHLS